MLMKGEREDKGGVKSRRKEGLRESMENLKVEREGQDVCSVGGSIKTEGVRQHLTH